jgi:beta-galactosidase/beta-glucuronidase
MKTRWQPDDPIPWTEYPRPQLRRERWLNLNGYWDYAVRPAGETAPLLFDGKILVPFPIESELSGVQRALQPDERLWYRRTFSLPADWEGQCILLHFGAVDFECQLWVNQRLIGSHRGGFLPFSFDISEALHRGENELLVAVSDPSDAGLQERGKQVLQPKGIWYSAVSGIWQTVWLEPVPALSISALTSIPAVDFGAVAVQVRLSTWDIPGESHCEIDLLDEDVMVASAVWQGGEACVLVVPQPKLWSLESPHLYGLRARLYQGNELVDKVTSYTALRKFSLERDTGGHLRFALNDKLLFLFGPLDQGYFPDGLYTPPSEAAMLFDIEFAKYIGCNMIRKHVKVEPARWYYHCDRLGMIVWQDMPNGGRPDKPWQAVLSLALGYKRNDSQGLRRFGRHQAENRAFYQEQLRSMIDHLNPFVCIAVWVPFNESWGQFHAREVAKWVKTLDPTRLVNHVSGWYDQGGGDFISRHIYVKTLRTAREDKHRAFVISEFGGYSLQIPGHLWDQQAKYGYRFFESRENLTQGYVDLLEQQLIPLIPKGLAAAIYTQTTDVEIEVNGYLTYDREVEKMDMEAVQKVHRKLVLS